mmetsp:Transcript_29911/g.33382  ORF Transcript_29911/g.33382 Transcript_29911/m.33382 type:complete len:471 (+) Transcript_29911:101-1513(+)
MATYHQVPQQVYYGSDVELSQADIDAIEMEPVSKESKKALKKAKKLAKKQDKIDNKKLTPSCCDKTNCEERRQRCKRKMKKVGKHAVNCCACWGCFSCISFLVLTITVMSAWSHFSHHVDECVHPKHFAMSSFEIDPKAYKSLELSLTIGRVKVHAVDAAKQSNIRLDVTRRSKIRESLSKVVASLNYEGTTASLSIETHSLSFHDCAHAEIDVYVPIGSNTEIKALVSLGDVEIIEVPQNTLKTVDAFVHAGAIIMDEVHAENVNLETRLGLVNTASVTSQEVSVKTQTGAALLKSIVAHTVSVETDTGDVEISKMQLPTGAGSLTANCNLGHLRMHGLVGGSKVDFKTQLGYLEVYFEKDHPFDGGFEASSPKGSLHMAGKSDPTMNLLANEETHVKGVVKGTKVAPRITTLASPSRHLTVTADNGRVSVDLLGLENHDCDHHHKHHHHNKHHHNKHHHRHGKHHHHE